jgi:hypothetical protein
MLRAAAAALIAAAFLIDPSPAPSDSAPPVALTRSAQWRAVAVQALTLYEAAPAPSSFQAMVHANALAAIGRLNGWQDPRVPVLLGQLMAERNPDGGWGIGVARGGLSGGTNPADTTYTVTLAGHVGPALLAAWQGGALTDPEPLQTITRLLVSQTPRLTIAEGQCVTYSRSANDGGHCVHNVSAGAADYLAQASAAGFGRSGLQRLVVDVTRWEVWAYRTDWSGWPYKDAQTTEQDPDHGSYSAASLYAAAYPVGREAAYQLLAAPATDDNGRRAHLRLVALPGGPGSQGLTDPSTTLWCEMGDQYLAEAAAYVTASAGVASNLSGTALLAAANSIACQEA